MTYTEKLDYLLTSEVVRMVMDGQFTPKEVDNAFRNLRKRVAHLEHAHELDEEVIASQRRQIDLLMEIK